jgi:hypothetical protein
MTDVPDAKNGIEADRRLACFETVFSALPYSAVSLSMLDRIHYCEDHPSQRFVRPFRSCDLRKL